MSQSTSEVLDYRNAAPQQPDPGRPEGTEHVNRLFLGCFASMFATSFAFIVRAMLITEWGERFGLSEAQKGAIFPGAALFPFAISIVLFSLFIDRVGYGKTMVFAFLGHVVGTVVTMLAITADGANSAYAYLYIGTFITALANGAVEAVINPVTATIYPRNKTHYLNILHAGWPGGLVLAGILSIFMVGKVSWIWVIALVFIPTVIYGVMLIGQRFPVQERVAAGVGYADMMREFGAGGAFLLAWFLTMAALTVASVFVPADAQQSAAWVQANNWLPPVVSVLTAVAFYAVYKSFGRPMFVFLLLVMILLATTELGTDGWVTDLLKPVFGANAGWVLIYTSFIMFVMRFFAGPIVHRINPLGLLCVCSAIAVVGLYWIGSVGGNAAMLFIAATLYGIGKSFFWPTTLGVVSEQFPRGGALTLNAMGGMGMIAVGVLGGDVLGTLVDYRVDRQLQQRPAIHSVVTKPAETTKYGLKYHDLDQTALTSLPADQKAEVEALRGETKQTTLRIVAILPAIMFVCYLGLIIYFRAKGGYRVQHLDMSGEKASGGVEGPVR